jgi:hypothetical protein
MRPHWNRDHPRNVEAADDRLRQRYEDRRQSTETTPFTVPDQLTRAIRDPRWSGEPVLVSAGARLVIAVAVTVGQEEVRAVGARGVRQPGVVAPWSGGAAADQPDGYGDEQR